MIGNYDLFRPLFMLDVNIFTHTPVSILYVIIVAYLSIYHYLKAVII